MALCQICKLYPAEKAGIIKDIYYKNVCQTCINMSFNVSAGLASYNRARDLEEHEADIRQPYSGGKPDSQFIHLYPERARELWSAEEIDRATRS